MHIFWGKNNNNKKRNPKNEKQPTGEKEKYKRKKKGGKVSEDIRPCVSLHKFLFLF